MQLFGSVAVAGYGGSSGHAETLGDHRPRRAEIASTLHFFYRDNVNGFAQLTQ